MQCVTLLLKSMWILDFRNVTLSALASNGNTLYNVMGVKRHIMPVDLPESGSISGTEINLTVCAVKNGVHILEFG